MRKSGSNAHRYTLQKFSSAISAALTARRIYCNPSVRFLSHNTRTVALSIKHTVVGFKDAALTWWSPPIRRARYPNASSGNVMPGSIEFSSASTFQTPTMPWSKQYNPVQASPWWNKTSPGIYSRAIFVLLIISSSPWLSAHHSVQSFAAQEKQSGRNNYFFTVGNFIVSAILSHTKVIIWPRLRTTKRSFFYICKLLT